MPSEIYLKSRKELRAWLLKNHQSTSGVWLIYDKGVNRKLFQEDITGEAICFGWIDSRVGKVDDYRSKIYLSPRNPKSNWSRVNKRLVSRLEKAKSLHASGKKAVVLAKKSGTWSQLDEVENLTVPNDLKLELRRHKNAEKYFNAFPRSVKRGILEWILNAKRSETREVRLKETSKLASQNIRILYRKIKK